MILRRVRAQDHLAVGERSGQLRDELPDNVDLRREDRMGLRRVVWRRRGADKLNHFIRWAKRRTAHLPVESRLSKMRAVLPDGLIGEHALLPELLGTSLGVLELLSLHLCEALFFELDALELFGAAALFFLRAGFKRTPVKGSVFGRAMRGAVGCLGMVIALTTALVWTSCGAGLGGGGDDGEGGGLDLQGAMVGGVAEAFVRDAFVDVATLEEALPVAEGLLELADENLPDEMKEKLEALPLPEHSRKRVMERAGKRLSSSFEKILRPSADTSKAPPPEGTRSKSEPGKAFSSSAARPAAWGS